MLIIIDNEDKRNKYNKYCSITLDSFASFSSIKQLEKTAELFGFTYSLIIEQPTNVPNFGVCRLRSFDLSHIIFEVMVGGFWSIDQLPKGVKKFKGLSNGGLVDCYFLNDGKVIKIFRPNPNAKEVYKELSIPERIEHFDKYGMY